jgi:hypothetical protein
VVPRTFLRDLCPYYSTTLFLQLLKISVGNKILIPEDLLKTREPMPQEFVDSFYKPKQEKVQPTKPGPSPAAEEPKLFGPKGQPQK